MLAANKFLLTVFSVAIVLFPGCKKKSCNCDCDLSAYNPTPYNINKPQSFPEMIIPADNPMTVEGVALGRKLFYEKKLSADNTQACASCHAQSFSFTDNGLRFSVGIDEIQGNRNAMAILNSGWSTSFFWDGRAASLEAQALGPVPNPIEMHQHWTDAVAKLEADTAYPELFVKAFGVCSIDSLHVVMAIAQFERTMISGNSKFDKVGRHEESFTASELNGFILFSRDKNNQTGEHGADCFHCHGSSGGLFTDHLFHNNGIDSVFADVGREAITGNEFDRGKFKTPTLRNVELTAPYMHDGRFATLEDVIEHYNMGGHPSATLDPLMKNVGVGLELTAEEKTDMVNFLKTLTDWDYINNPEFAEP